MLVIPIMGSRCLYRCHSLCALLTQARVCYNSSCAWGCLQASDHMAADTSLFRTDSLRPLVVDSMRVAVQELKQVIQQQGKQPGEVGRAITPSVEGTNTAFCTYRCCCWRLDASCFCWCVTVSSRNCGVWFAPGAGSAFWLLQH